MGRYTNLLLNRPPSGPERRMAAADPRQSALAASMNVQGPDPLLEFYDNWWDGVTGQGQGSGWFGMNTIPQELVRLGNVYDAADELDLANDQYDAAFFDSNLLPGPGAGVGTIGRVTPKIDDIEILDAARVADDMVGPTIGGPLTFSSDLALRPHSIPVEEMSRTVIDPQNLLPRKIISPSDMQNSYIYPFPGDRSARDGFLTEINSVPLAHRVEMEGGVDFMRDARNQSYGNVWASGGNVPARLQNDINNIARTFDTNNINLVYTANSARNADFSTMMSDAIIAQLPSSPILRKTVKQFDAEMKNKVANWPGVESDSLMAFLSAPEMGKARKEFVELVGKGKYQKLGFPDVGSTRYAITQPELLGVPTGATGYGIGRGIPGAPIDVNPILPHKTYPQQVKGEYLGGLQANVPKELMWPDWYAKRRESGAELKYDDYTFGRQLPVQKATQEWVDNLEAYLESLDN